MSIPAPVKLPKSKRTVDAEAVAANESATVPHVVWYKDAGLRKLYGLTVIIIISSATNGYDG
jgi:hypothetical protein